MAKQLTLRLPEPPIPHSQIGNYYKIIWFPMSDLKKNHIFHIIKLIIY